ncbi:uncharacterized protein LOC110026542 [Phalaenopsis equestris]|uniref:uncharacterized protein LOC110026542 n=1 Tax=Phalaenopsis equestris TaxID=78828 RepID=UPI0009E6387E|nr:uncharacterized protein LOC110026542 [Phalaenopsis equestris]
MPAMDYQGSSFGRSLLSLRREQFDAQVDPGSSREQELDSFQRLVADLFSDLASDGEELLSLVWIRKLLEAFLLSHEEFRVILLNSGPILARAPLERLMSDFYERSVKALDICNAIRDGIEQIRQWQKHIEIVLIALDPRHNPIGEGQLRRAKKALTDLAILMLDVKDSASVLAQRNRSFGRNNTSSSKDRGHFRSLSWSVSRSWSAAKQLQAIGNNINAPRGNDVVATNGVVNPIFTMNTMLHFVMWALVAAIPCQDRGVQTHFSIPRNFTWGPSVQLLHDRIMEESKKKERKNSLGLLKEIHQIEKCIRNLLELMDSVQFPLTEEKEVELRQGVLVLAGVHHAMKEELEPLEPQVREVFHRIVRSRTEGLDCLHKQD